MPAARRSARGWGWRSSTCRSGFAFGQNSHPAASDPANRCFRYDVGPNSFGRCWSDGLTKAKVRAACERPIARLHQVIRPVNFPSHDLRYGRQVFMKAKTRESARFPTMVLGFACYPDLRFRERSTLGALWAFGVRIEKRQRLASSGISGFAAECLESTVLQSFMLYRVECFEFLSELLGSLPVSVVSGSRADLSMGQRRRSENFASWMKIMAPLVAKVGLRQNRDDEVHPSVFHTPDAIPLSDLEA